MIVEIIGLAGAGKSTLTDALCLKSQGVLPASYLQIREVRHMPYFIKHALRSLPRFLSHQREGRSLTRREIVKIVCLDGWHQVMKRQAANTGAVIVSDQGPIYDLATLFGFGPEWLRSIHHSQWWATMFQQWSQTIDMVVWLDAPEEVLIKRIRSRQKWHPVKEESTSAMIDYLSRYRSAHEYVMREMLTVGTPKVLRFDTARQTMDEIISEVLVAAYPEKT